jgi:hypothetical protein
MYDFEVMHTSLLLPTQNCEVRTHLYRSLLSVCPKCLSKQQQTKASMECIICFNEFDMNIHTPLILNCGHSFCSNCMSLLFQKNKGSSTKKNKKGENSGSISCPTCKVTHRCRNIESIAQNHALVQSLEQIKQEKERLQEIEKQQREQELKTIPSDVPLPSYGRAFCPVHGECHTWYDMQCEQMRCDQCPKSDLCSESIIFIFSFF